MTERGLSFHWFLPTYGDSRGLMAGGHGSFMSGDRPATLRYLNQLTAAAEDNGFEGVLTPTGAWCEDAWLTTAMLVQTSETLKFLVALRPGLTSPTLAAQMAATFQRHSAGRLLLNVVTGGEQREQEAYGDFLDKTQRYARTGEFLHIVRELWSRTEPFSFTGEHLQVKDAILSTRPDPIPPVFFGGSSAVRPDRSPPATPIPTSPGVNPSTLSPRNWTGSADWPRSKAARSTSACAST